MVSFKILTISAMALSATGATASPYSPPVTTTPCETTTTTTVAPVATGYDDVDAATVTPPPIPTTTPCLEAIQTPTQTPPYIEPTHVPNSGSYSDNSDNKADQNSSPSSTDNGNSTAGAGLQNDGYSYQSNIFASSADHIVARSLGAAGIIAGAAVLLL